MRKVNDYLRATLVALLALLLVFGGVPAPALAEMAEEAMGEEPAAAVGTTREPAKRNEGELGTESRSAEPAPSAESLVEGASGGELSPASDGPAASELAPEGAAAGAEELVPEGPATDADELAVEESALASKVMLAPQGVEIMGDATTFSMGGSHSAAIKPDGSLLMWGSNSSGELGDGTYTDSRTPKKVLDGVVAVSLGRSHSAAIKSDGTLWMWGSNGRGQLGDGTTVRQNRPKKVMEGVKAVSLGEDFSAAVKTDGSLWTWGSNTWRTLGYGESDYNAHPTPRKIMDGVEAVSLGGTHSAAIKTDGSLWTWGYNYNGSLGNGTTQDQQTPCQVMTGVKAVSLGGGHTAAIKNDGSLWIWGNGAYGKRGDGMVNANTSDNGIYANNPTPTRLMGDVVAVSLGSQHSAAVKSNGDLWTWGWNSSGQLGDGTTTNAYSPKKVMDSVAAVSLGVSHSAAVKSDGSLWTWGWNKYGQLGDGTTADKSRASVVNGVTVKVAPLAFPDVAPSAWYAGVVSRAVGLGIMSGYKDGRFGPADKITRGQVAVALWNMAGNSAAGAGAKAFSDVKSTDYFYNAVRWASSKGVVSGYGNGKFGPKDSVTREQFAAMLANYAKNVKGRTVSGSKSDFSSMKDKDKVSSWAVPSVGWCFRNKILSGSGGNVNPGGNTDRAEAAKMVVVLHDLLG